MGAQQLTGFTVPIKGRNADVYGWPVLQLGLTSGGIFVPLLVDPTGALVVDPSGGSGTQNVAISQAMPGTTNGVVDLGGFTIAPYTSITYTYLNSTNNVGTAVYMNGATTVRTLTFAYVNGAAENNDLVQSITAS